MNGVSGGGDSSGAARFEPRGPRLPKDGGLKPHLSKDLNSRITELVQALRSEAFDKMDTVNMKIKGDYGVDLISFMEPDVEGWERRLLTGSIEESVDRLAKAVLETNPKLKSLIKAEKAPESPRVVPKKLHNMFVRYVQLFTQMRAMFEEQELFMGTPEEKADFQKTFKDLANQEQALSADIQTLCDLDPLIALDSIFRLDRPQSEYVQYLEAFYKGIKPKAKFTPETVEGRGKPEGLNRTAEKNPFVQEGIEGYQPHFFHQIFEVYKSLLEEIRDDESLSLDEKITQLKENLIAKVRSLNHFKERVDRDLFKEIMGCAVAPSSPVDPDPDIPLDDPTVKNLASAYRRGSLVLEGKGIKGDAWTEGERILKYEIVSPEELDWIVQTIEARFVPGPGNMFLKETKRKIIFS